MSQGAGAEAPLGSAHVPKADPLSSSTTLSPEAPALSRTEDALVIYVGTNDAPTSTTPR